MADLTVSQDARNLAAGEGQVVVLSRNSDGKPFVMFIIQEI